MSHLFFGAFDYAHAHPDTVVRFFPAGDEPLNYVEINSKIIITETTDPARRFRVTRCTAYDLEPVTAYNLCGARAYVSAAGWFMFDASNLDMAQFGAAKERFIHALEHRRPPPRVLLTPRDKYFDSFFNAARSA